MRGSLPPHRVAAARLAARATLVLSLAACAGDPSAASIAGLPPAARTATPSVSDTNARALLVSAFSYWNGFDFIVPAGPPWPNLPPTPWSPSDFDVAIHMRDQAVWYTPEPFRAMHGTNCEPYQNAEPVNDVRPGDTGSHDVSTYADLNYRCRNHMMTAIKASGYGAVYLTPNAMVDFTDGEAVVKYAMSTLHMSSRDWVDLWITPWSDNLELPLDGSLGLSTDLQGPPRTAVHVRMTGDRTHSRFEAYVVNNFAEGRLPVVNANGYESILLPVSTRRDTFELRISKTHLKFGMRKLSSPDEPAGSITWVDANVRLPWTRGVVQFGHHSLNPSYGGGSPGTWHWDDFTIAPAVPFTIIRTLRSDGSRVRYVDAGSAADPVPFEHPAPADAYLRFAAFGTGIQFSVDGGATWTDARVQPAALNRVDRFRSYWTAIPSGISAVLFRRTGTATGPWMVRDMSIWSLSQ